MVKLGPFQVELVEAESGRPFTEHNAEDGKTYFESEPDAEYFISVTPMERTPTKVAFRLKIDGQDVGGYRCVDTNILHLSRKFGLSQREGTTGYHKALKFVKPPKGNFEEYNTNDGTIEIIMCEVKKLRRKTSCSKRNWNVTLDKASERGLRPFVNDKKHVRSAEGSIKTAAKTYHAEYDWARGERLGSYVIYYCSVEKLISLGVLPRAPTSRSGMGRPAAAAIISPSSSPSAPVHHHPTRVFLESQERGFNKERGLFHLSAGEDGFMAPCPSSLPPAPVVRQPKRICMESQELGVKREHDLYDLTGEDSDDDE